MTRKSRGRSAGKVSVQFNTAFRRWEVHRPVSRPEPQLPFWVEYAGHYQSRAGFLSNVSIISFVQVFWCAAGEGILVINGRERFLRANQIALYFPKMEHRYYGINGTNWDIYWWTMGGPLAPSITAAFGLNADVYDAGAAPTGLFQRLGRALRNPAPYGEAQAVGIAFQLLARAGFSHVTSDNRADAEMSGLVDHIHANWNKPVLNIKYLSGLTGINRASLSRRFRKTLGIPPGEYIARLRLQNAAAMLSDTKKSVTDVAGSCGYLDRHYFSRLLKRRLGYSPRQLRKNASRGR